MWIGHNKLRYSYIFTIQGVANSHAALQGRLPVVRWPRVPRQGKILSVSAHHPLHSGLAPYELGRVGRSGQVRSGQVRVFIRPLGPRPQTSSRHTYYPKHIILATLGHIYQSNRV